MNAELGDARRLEALVRSGLSAEPDARMDHFAGWVRRALDVPVALVSIVTADQQLYPGMSGLPEPWATKRATPLTHSFCRHVIATAEPLVIEDARTSDLPEARLAAAELGAVAYAGMPVTDGGTTVLGSLCAIDTVPRHWTQAQLTALRDLAAACSAEVALRMARFDADRERDRRDELEAVQERSLGWSEALLAASQAFADTVTVGDVRSQIATLVSTDLGPSYVGLVLLDDTRRMQRLPDPLIGPGLEDAGPWTNFPLTDALPTADAVRQGRLVHYSDPASFDAVYSAEAGRLMHDLGLHACAAAPLPGPDGPLGALLLGWSAPRELDVTDRVMITTVAGFAAHAITRARRLAHRVSVAHGMQEAMLTNLPGVTGLEMSATYRPADTREHVGGDWYDAITVPEDGVPEGVVVVSVGDVIGHEMRAASLMGQARSMLRQAAWDHPGGPPSRIFAAFEEANRGLEVDVAGSAVLAQLRREHAGAWTLTWTNAGHPPPVLVGPDGCAELLTEHDVLFGMGIVAPRGRRDHTRVVAPGSLLLLYSDGLIERRGQNLDTGIDAVLAALDRIGGIPTPELVDAVVDEVAPDGRDDVVVFAIRFPHP
jgi:GAF domain-containing protein